MKKFKVGSFESLSVSLKILNILLHLRLQHLLWEEKPFFLSFLRLHISELLGGIGGGGKSSKISPMIS